MSEICFDKHKRIALTDELIQVYHMNGLKLCLLCLNKHFHSS